MNKQYIRNKISKIASYTEIYISALIIIGILLLSVTIIKDLYMILQSFVEHSLKLDVEEFLSHALQLIIGIEFVKMLVKHTPGSAVEVLLFTIARKLITDHGSMLDLLIGVIAIAVLFATRKYLNIWQHHDSEDSTVVNSGSTVEEVNKKLGVAVCTDLGNTIAGVIANEAKKKNQKIRPGYKIRSGNCEMEIYSMDEDLIKQVRIIPDNKLS